MFGIALFLFCFFGAKRLWKNTPPCSMWELFTNKIIDYSSAFVGSQHHDQCCAVNSCWSVHQRSAKLPLPCKLKVSDFLEKVYSTKTVSNNAHDTNNPQQAQVYPKQIQQKQSFFVAKQVMLTNQHFFGSPTNQCSTDVFLAVETLWSPHLKCWISSLSLGRRRAFHKWLKCLKFFP